MGCTGHCEPLRFRPTVLKKPSAVVKRKPVSSFNKKLIVEVDEVFLNKGKFTRLSAYQEADVDVGIGCAQLP
eukprot:1656656-Amphidinium_carterae.1